MTKDELIRALASTRTDLNKSQLVLTAAVGEVSEEGLTTALHTIPYLQSAVEMVADAANELNSAIDTLNEKK